MGYWAAFARDGAPSAANQPEWRAYNGERAYMAFEDVPHMRAGPPNSYEIHEAVVCRRRAAGSVAWNWNVGVISPPLPPEAPHCQ
jgi:para-nitrobenzyl esterase